MARKVWSFELEDGRHTVELEHGLFSGKRVIQIDGQVVEESTKFFGTASEFHFDVGGHTYDVRIDMEAGSNQAYGLTVDGYPILNENDRAVGPMPVWGWLFVVACGAIPVVSLGGAIPAAVGFGGAAGCYAVARDSSRSTGMRLAICAVITVICWGVFLALLGGMTRLFG